MAKPIPDRWLDYEPIGKRVEGTRFVAFKVPLREHIIKDVEPKKQLNGNILLKTLPNMGMIIDLTNTNRYYDPAFFIKQGLEYCKVMIPGQNTPPKPLINRFKAAVQNYIKCNPNNDKLIGIHCTHGVNRTGFLICNYMISELNINPIEAINRFARARGHKIERENYLESLHQLLNSKEDSETHAVNINQTIKNTTVQNWRTEDRDQRSYWRTERNNNYSNWRSPYGRSAPYPQQNRQLEGFYNNDSSNTNYRPIDSNIAFGSHDQHNYQPRIRTDYYNTTPSPFGRSHRKQHIAKQQPYNRQN